MDKNHYIYQEWHLIPRWCLRSIFPWLAKQLLKVGILRKSWQVVNDRILLERCSCGFVLPILKYCSAVWCLVANTNLKLLDRIVSSASILAGGVFKCTIAHHWSMAVLYMLCNIKCNTMHPLNGALPVPYVCASTNYTQCFDCTLVFLRGYGSKKFFSLFTIISQ